MCMMFQGDGLKLTFHKRAKEKERRQAETLEADKGNVIMLSSRTPEIIDQINNISAC